MNEELRLSTLARLAGGELRGADRAARGAAIDARRLEPGEVFFALRGERRDGHDFLAQAAAAGAAGAVVERPLDDADADNLPQIVVADTRAALGAAAAGWRRLLGQGGLRVAGVTGSNGKTTVTQMLASILRARGAAATRGNQNNRLGVALTLLSLRPEHALAVVELGASAPGEIRALCRLAAPEVGVVLNAAPAHIEGFGDIASVARAKGELFESLPAAGVGVVNCDDPFCHYWRAALAPRRVVGFGLEHPAEVAGELLDNGRLALRAQGQERVLRPGLPGRHNALNALAATAVALELGAELDEIAAALEAMRPVPGRMSPAPAAGFELIDDCYNANPESLRAALAFLHDKGGESWLVLGDMAELGDAAADLHAQAGASARRLGVRRLYATGELARRAADAFGAGARHFDTPEALAAELLAARPAGVTVLVKGSRAAGLERVINALSAADGAAQATGGTAC